jgi:hypothetical protein
MGDQLNQNTYDGGGSGGGDGGYTDRDILPFRGGHSSSHPGNVRHNDAVFGGVLDWLTDENTTWAAITDRILNEIRQAGGRHLRWNSRIGDWVELDEKQRRQKVDQAMRSRLRWFRQFGSAESRRIRVVDAATIGKNAYLRGRGGECDRIEFARESATNVPRFIRTCDDRQS